MKSAASILALATSALAATIEVQVSSVFTPDSITAADGDIIQFNFQSQHSVARSDFSSPCVGATDNAIYSGQLNSVRTPQYELDMHNELTTSEGRCLLLHLQRQ